MPHCRDGMIELSSASSGEELLHDARSSSPTVAGSNATASPGATAATSEMGDAAKQKQETPEPGPSKGEEIRSRQKTKRVYAKTQEVIVEDFHVFHWLAAVPKPSNGEDESKRHSHSAMPGHKEQYSKYSITITVDNR